MEYMFLVARICCYLLFYVTLSGVQCSQIQYELLDQLFHQGYNKLVRPVLDESLAINVTQQMVLTDITRVDEMNHQVELNVWMRRFWKDEYLSWDKKLFGGKSQLVIPSKYIWLPDIILYNSVEDPARKIEKTSHVTLQYDGTVRWSQPVTLRAACQMNLKAFPFDQQCCTLRFGSWSYDASSIDLHIPEADPWDIKSEYHENGEWKLIHATSFRNVTKYKLPANATDTANTLVYTWPEVFFNLQLQRKYNFYLFTLLIPYFLISGLSSLVFFLQPESGEKMSLAITTLLSLVVFNEYVMNIVPPSADFFPLLSVYFLIMIIWVGMCVVLSSWILHIYHQEENCSRMRPWLRVVVFVILARAVGMCDAERKNALSFNEALVSDDEESEEPRQFSLANGMRQMVNHCPDDNDNHFGSSNSTRSLEIEVFKIRKHLTTHKEEEKKRDAQLAALKEWRNAAKIVDRFFFWVYSLFNMSLAAFFTLKSLDSSGAAVDSACTDY